MATIRILSRCAGGEHLTVAVTMADATVRTFPLALSDLRAPLTQDDLLAWAKVNMRLAGKTDNALTFLQLKTAIESRTFTE